MSFTHVNESFIYTHSTHSTHSITMIQHQDYNSLRVRTVLKKDMQAFLYLLQLST